MGIEVTIPFSRARMGLLLGFILAFRAFPAPAMAGGFSGEDHLSLRELAERAGIGIGAAMSFRAYPEDERYSKILAREFNRVTAENVMKFASLAREEGRYDFRPSDELVDFARTHGMKVRGHTLVWHQQAPNWVSEEKLEPEEIREILRRHIFTAVGRYRGQVAAWDVVNEAIEEDGSLRDTIWLRALGPGYIADAFRWAHEADPGAELYYNDYSGEGLGEKSDGIYELVKRLKETGAPVHGVGLQMHLVLDSHPPLEDIAANMQRLGQLGLKVAVTEMDVRIKEPVTAGKLERQAELYAGVLRLVLAADNCRELVLWGFTDRYSWIPHWFPGTGAGLVFDEDYRPKPAYDAVRQVLEEWSGKNE